MPRALTSVSNHEFWTMSLMQIGLVLDPCLDQWGMFMSSGRNNHRPVLVDGEGDIPYRGQYKYSTEGQLSYTYDSIIINI